MKFSVEELAAQKKMIIRVLEYGTPEEQKLLEKAEADPELHAEIKKLIEDCRLTIKIVDAVGYESLLNHEDKPEGTIDLEVARLARSIGGIELAKTMVKVDQNLIGKNKKYYVS